jgi:hypothetical protein
MDEREEEKAKLLCVGFPVLLSVTLSTPLATASASWEFQPSRWVFSQRSLVFERAPGFKTVCRIQSVCAKTGGKEVLRETLELKLSSLPLLAFTQTLHVRVEEF